MSTQPNFAVVLSGCGPKDGSEIHEAVSALIAISKFGATYQIFAPDIEQKHVIDHITGEEMNQSRNVMVEAARIARGDIRPIEELSVEDFDGIVFPGGFGAAKNLFTYAFDGAEFDILPQVSRVVMEFYQHKKPIGAMCIAPVMIAKLLGRNNVTVTLGPDSDLSSSLNELYGATIKSVKENEALSDSVNKVVTTPCYMYGDNTIANVALGAERMVQELISML